MNKIKKYIKNFMAIIIGDLVSRKAIKSGYIFKTDCSSILLNPYAEIDAIGLHLGVAGYFAKMNVKSTMFVPKTSFDPNNCVSVGSDNKFNFLELQMEIKKICSDINMDDYYYPVLDDFIKNLSFQNLMFGSLKYEIFICELQKVRENAIAFASKFDGLMLADSAYLVNYSLKSEFLRLKKKVAYLNPIGKYFEYNEINISEFSAKNTPMPELVDKYAKFKNEIDLYINERFGGRSKGDMDSSRAFSNSIVTDDGLPKRVLLLHAFRDANNITWDHGQAFDSYIEWVDSTFEIIAKSPEQWAVKIHPSSDYYRDDMKIFDALRLKHQIDSNVFSYQINTKDLLTNDCVIYTNQGTVVLESMAMGKRTIFCGPRYDPFFGIKAKNKREWVNLLTLDVDELREICFSNVDHVRPAAAYTLWNQFSRKNISLICPTRPINPSDDKIDRIVLMLKYLQKLIAK